jgi:hypothetical protein
MWSRLLESTRLLRSNPDGTADGAADAPVRLILAAMALGLLVGAIVSRTPDEPPVIADGVRTPVSIEDQAGVGRPTVEDAPTPEAGAAGRSGRS